MEITKENIEELKLIFVTREECDDTTRELNDKLTRDFTDLAVIKEQNKMILRILSAVGLAVLALVVRQFWGVSI